MDQGRGRFEASLSEEGRYRLLIEAVVDYAIYMLDRDGVIASWNPGAQRFKGFAASEVIGSHFSRFYTENDRRAGLPGRALETAAREGKFEGEGWRVRKDGTRFWAHVVIDPIRAPSGDLIGFVKITRDLSERIAADDALRKSDDQFRRLVQSVTDYAIYMLDANGRVSSWNVGAERIKGYSPEEIIGKHYSCFFTDDDRASGQPTRALEIAARDGRFENEGWRVRKDGTQFWASVVVDAIRDERGAIVGFAKVTRDATERRNQEQALAQAREALFQSQKMDAVGQLTGGVAHDFNNLLMAVLGSLQIVRKRVPEDPKTLRLIDNAIQGAQRGVSLTQRMLAFARRQELKPSAVDVPTLVRGMTDLLERSIGPLITIETRFPAALDAAQADANQLELALLNLVMNARDAMPDDGGRIVIAARSERVAAGNADKLDAGDYVCLSVSDSGAGMDEGTLSRAAEPFFTTKGVGKGTGLGLSMVHGLAEQSGGRFVLTSQPGKGTTAEIWLPVATGRNVFDHAEVVVPDVRLGGRPLVVVAVDDDSLVLMNTAALLEELGHTVIEANSAQDALRMLNAHHGVDLLITDQAMPHITGMQLIEAIRIQRPDLPIILMTGYADLPAGVGINLPRLMKPFGQDELAQAIAEAIVGAHA
jgi:PAS domain S-box-containing protein